ncbi:hypothetical protein [Rossellomorea sp. KS-H15a]|uniref:hypothetical protein n=1 Tax=Rossellomorea sp. KS-H15a TaxID=2963940 RepID=UPI0020C61C31|nr:hypothetical protein [Rossellomorea sp. KS-H15a]UTE78343.1 hypothetical protein M1J35_06135 [Rossellomorea sp. KS-H15a]
MKKRSILAGGLLFVGLFAFYWLYVEKTDSRPKNEEILSQINSSLHNAQAIEIQDFLKLDDGHGVAPFISDREQYGVSYWERHLTGWKVISIRTDGEPKVWELDGSDPSSFHIVWNINPGSDIQTLQYYFTRERGYSSSGEQQHYVPGILMKTEASLTGNSYGAMKVPGEWGDALTLSDGSDAPDPLFGDNINMGIHSRFGWIPLDENNKEVEWKNSTNNSSYYKGNVREQHMQLLDQYQIEQGEF